MALLRSEEVRTLLELGAGPGKDGEFFRDSGLEMVCTDLSPEMLALCASKGLAARLIGLSKLDLPPGTFDAGYAPNCLLHVPDRELPAALRGIRAVLKPGGLFYLGVYGGTEHEGVWPVIPTPRSGTSPSAPTSGSGRSSPARSRFTPSGEQHLTSGRPDCTFSP